MKIVLVIFLFLLMSGSGLMAQELDVEHIARTSLEKNIVHLPQGDFLAAGAHQFGSLWTRDFCFSVPGLLLLKKFSLVKNQLNYLIKNRREDGLVPIYADSISPLLRVAAGSFSKATGLNIQFKLTGKIKPFYRANGAYATIDANMLVLLAAYEYYHASGDEQWWLEQQSNFQEIYDYYQPFFHEGLIVQGAYSDWQDSAKRVGKTFFTNLLFLDVSKKFHFLDNDELENFTQKIHESFYDLNTGLYFSVKGFPQISLDAILWAIDNNLMPHTDQLYLHLKKHPLWNLYGVAGFATFPSYPRSWIAPQVLLSGLSEYHGSLSWSWLMAYSSMVAYKQGDLAEAMRLKSLLETFIRRDQTVFEIYDTSREFRVFNSYLYHSESPFSWGASYVLEMQQILGR